MKKTQRRFEIIDGRIARNDDGDPIARRLLHRRENQRARFDGRAGNLDASLRSERALKKRRVRSERAQMLNQSIVAIGHARAIV